MNGVPPRPSRRGPSLLPLGHVGLPEGPFPAPSPAGIAGAREAVPLRFPQEVRRRWVVGAVLSHLWARRGSLRGP